MRSTLKSQLFYIRRKKTSQESMNLGLYIFDPEVDHLIDPQDKFAQINDNIDLHNFAYYKPTFFGLLHVTQEIKNRDQNTMSISQLTTIIRHICDSKLKEFLLVNDPTRYTHFPQFVFSWFSAFHLDTRTRQLVRLPIDKRRSYSNSKMLQFYKDLMSKNFDQIWEVVTFREFLMEHQSIEQVYFYLQCRNSLFILAKIAPAQIRAQVRVFVSFSNAVKLVDLVLDNYEAWSVNFIKDKMKQKIVKKGDNQLIESGFVLRCLLEYYRIERVNRYKFIKKSYEQCGGVMNSISFDGFMSIFDWFKGTSIAEKVSLYRECFAVGHGNITPEIIFTVCTERNFFLRHIRLSCTFKFPTHKGRKNMVEEQSNTTELIERITYYIEPSQPYLYNIYRVLKRLFQPSGVLYHRLEEQGVEPMLTNFEYFKTLINKNRFYVESSALKGRHFVHFLAPLAEQVRRIAMSNLYQLLQARKQPLQKYGDIPLDLSENQIAEFYGQDILHWQKLFLWSEEQLNWKKKVNQFRLNFCARKIQKAIRQKLLKPYLDIYQKLLQKVEQNKTLIVAELKKKYKK